MCGPVLDPGGAWSDQRHQALRMSRCLQPAEHHKVPLGAGPRTSLPITWARQISVSGTIKSAAAAVLLLAGPEGEADQLDLE